MTSLDLANQHQVQLASVTGGDIDLSTSDGRFLATILSGCGRERKAKTRRAVVLRQKRQAREEGRMTGGPRPFGWKAVQAVSKTGEPLFIVKDAKGNPMTTTVYTDGATPKMTWRGDELDEVQAAIIRKAIDSVFKRCVAGRSRAAMEQRSRPPAANRRVTVDGAARQSSSAQSQHCRASQAFSGDIIRKAHGLRSLIARPGSAAAHCWPDARPVLVFRGAGLY